MRSDNISLTWKQQVEYNKVKSFGRDLNMQLRLRHNNTIIEMNAEELLNDC